MAEALDRVHSSMHESHVDTNSECIRVLKKYKIRFVYERCWLRRSPRPQIFPEQQQPCLDRCFLRQRPFLKVRLASLMSFTNPGPLALGASRERHKLRGIHAKTAAGELGPKTLRCSWHVKIGFCVRGRQSSVRRTAAATALITGHSIAIIIWKRY